MTEVTLETLELKVPKDLVGLVGSYLIMKDEIIFDPFEESTLNNLKLAAEYGLLTEVKRMIDKGVKPEIEVIEEAVKAGHYDVVKYLLDGKAPVGRDLLNTASWKGRYNVVELLLDRKVTTDRAYAHFAIESAAFKGYRDIVELLMDHFEFDDPEEKAMNNAIENGHLSVVNLLIERGIKIYPYMVTSAAINNHLDVLKLFLEAGNRMDKDALRHWINNFNPRIRKTLERYKS